MYRDSTRNCRKMTKRDLALIAIFCSFWAMSLPIAGCSHGSGSGGAAVVEGKVTVNRVPLKHGQIQFIPLSGTPGTAVKATIEEGKYRAEGLSTGSYSVTFGAVRSTGKTRTEHGMQIPETENLIPAKYAAGLEMSISGDRETKDFNL
jgi:hypothetical protein